MPSALERRNRFWNKKSVDWFIKQLPVYPYPDNLKFIFYGTISESAKQYYLRHGLQYYEELEVRRILYDNDTSFDYFLPYLHKLNRITLPQYTDLYRQISYFGIEDSHVYFHTEFNFARFKVQAQTGVKQCDDRHINECTGWFNVCESCFILGHHYAPLQRIYEVTDLSLIDQQAEYFNKHITGHNWDNLFELLRQGNFTYDYFERYKLFDIDTDICHCCYTLLLDNFIATSKANYFNHCSHCYVDLFFEDDSDDEDMILLDMIHTRKYTINDFPKSDIYQLWYQREIVKRNLMSDFDSVWLDCKKQPINIDRHVPSLFYFAFQTLINNRNLPINGRWINQ